MLPRPLALAVLGLWLAADVMRYAWRERRCSH
mgnify:CR=1 FL=1